MTLAPDGPWQKYLRAEHHFEGLWREIEIFEQTHSYSITCEVDAQAGAYDFYVKGLQPVDPSWGLQLGDVVHNLRSALDHLVVLLIGLCTGKPHSEIDFGDFPIFGAPRGLQAGRPN